ncbi:MAG: hypothetical protein ACEY3D_02250 [Rickettsia sp.]
MVSIFYWIPLQAYRMTERGATESFHATMPRGNDIEAMKQDR